MAKLDSSREIRAQIEMHEFLLVHLFAQLVEHLPFGEDMLGNVVVNAEQHITNQRIAENNGKQVPLKLEKASFGKFAGKLNYLLNRPAGGVDECYPED